MNLRLLPILFIVLISSASLFAQCPPPGFPEPGNNCPDAPILCENLDGYCATINNNNQSRAFPCCPGWTLNNDEWFGFFAGTTTIIIDITPSNCLPGTNGNLGLQSAIYATCPPNNASNAWCNSNLMDSQCSCDQNTFTLSSTNFVVGQVYWFVFDGCSGSVCDYTIHVLEGSTVGFAPANPGAITGSSSVCHGISTGYSVELATGATSYDWTLTPSNAGELAINGDSVTVAWSDTFSGTAKLCVATSNKCYSSASESCYEIEVQGNVNQTESITLCPGDSVILDGQVYNQSATVLDTLPSISGCDTIVTYTITLLPYPTRAESISFCPGDAVIIGGQVYSQSGTVVDTITSLTACDTIVTHVLTLLPYPTRSESISLCPGESVTIGEQLYNQSGTVIDTIPALTGCDTIVTYTLTLLPYPTRMESISFCPGEAVTIGGQVYSQSGTVIDTIPSAAGGCDTIVTYTLLLLPQPARSETIAFCPGETISLGGVNYTQPGTVVLKAPSQTAGECDTIVTYTLKFLTPAPSNVSIVCPTPVTITQSNTSGTQVNYALPTASTDCTCPGIVLTLTNGLASGSNFPLGLSSVCFTARDSCGQSASCCFNITIEAADMVCDTKVNGCIKYELLSITEDVHKNKTYRIRLTNNCSNKLIYAAFQIPDGMMAIEPANLSTYTAPSGNTYLVRNPNFTPQYSIRYSSISDSIHLGESDIFKYTLPAQANVTFINVTSRLEPNIYLSAHLNTFYCPIGVTPANNQSISERAKKTANETQPCTKLLLFPNPASQLVGVQTAGQTGELVVQDAIGHIVMRQSLRSANTEFSVTELSNGLYQVVFYGEKVVQHGALLVQH